jgi:Porin subfamily
MKLVKSLILGSTAGVLAVAGAQAADLPSRKAAPVEYVRICDAFGTGYFYIPGTDSCLRIGGRIRAEYRWQNKAATYSIPAGAAFFDRAGVALGAGSLGAAYSGTFLVNPSKLQDQTGMRTRGRIEADVRTQTAWGTLRTFFRFEIDYNTGSYVNKSGSLANNGTGDTNFNPYTDKGFIQFAGITAGRAQSMFDFYADNYGYQDIRGSDASVNLLAYTATFGGGFSATISIEDSTARRAGVLGNFNVPGVGLNGGAYTGAAYNGQSWPDLVAALRVDQPWGAAQLSAAVHNQNASALVALPVPVAPAFGPVGTYGIGGNSVGYAIQGGVQIKLPMLAAGDDLWLQATYAKGALDYQQVGAQEFGRINNGNGWTFGGDAETVFYVDNNGFLHHTSPTSWSVVAAINHYFTPTFATSLRGSYLNVSYGNGASFPYSGAAGVAVAGVPAAVNSWSEWRVGINPEWYPVKGLTFGFELMYVHLNQKAPLISGATTGSVFAYGGGLVGPAGGPYGVQAWKSNTNGWEARLRVQRDF